MDSAARAQPIVQVRSGSIFTVFRGVGLVLAILSLFYWDSATAVNDSAGEAGGLVFLVISAGTVALALIAGRSVTLFANQEMVGIVGPFGGVRVLPRSELAEIRTIWHWYQGGGMGYWVFPALHFRKRDASDAFMTLALLYETGDLAALGAYLGIAIKLDRPSTRKAA